VFFSIEAFTPSAAYWDWCEGQHMNRGLRVPQSVSYAVNVYSRDYEGCGPWSLNGATSISGGRHTRNIGIPGTSHTKIDDDPLTEYIFRTVVMKATEGQHKARA
jgi:hypothetical protein